MTVPLSLRYALNEFRAHVRVPGADERQRFDGFFDAAPDGAGPQLPDVEISATGPAAPADCHVDVDGVAVPVIRTGRGHTVWAGLGATEYHTVTAARRILRDVWLAHRLRRSRTAFLHASAVDDGRRLVVFVGDKRAGKTSLMLDAVLHHGWRSVSNDCLLVFEGPAGLSVSGLPTYLGIRPDVARRFEPALRARLAGDAANRDSYRRWNAAADATDEGKLYVSPGLLGRPSFPTIPLTQRSLTIVSAAFARDGRADVRDMLDADPLTWLVANCKPMTFLLRQLRLGPDGPFPVEREELTALAASARFLGYRHTGLVEEVLEHAATVPG